MRIGSAASYHNDVAVLQLLSRSTSSSGKAAAASSGGAGSGGWDPAGSSNAASSLLTYTAAGTLSGSAGTVSLLKTMAASSTFANAAKGVVDDQVRALVRDGKIATLPPPKDFDPSNLSTAEQNIYHVVQGLQSLYDIQPKTLDEALANHVKTIVDTYPEMIARMKDGLASGTLPESDGWKDVIAKSEADLEAAQQGRMKITAVDDPKLVQTTNEFTVRFDGIGWSGSGTKTTANIPALQELTGSKNVWAGGGPYTNNYVISW
ncbi:hypothetical protein [Rhodopseudomonas palustris]|uniref:hypothetical protein n=1 Tax=Rhodopseudomonas palustris TaxID=1076 RepID=UPI000E5C2DAA|nr:hypothetical protein [Rhodopseudomonas palustris]QLH71257.1 hypothetical protein HZF03_10845 [Rhodopseudomonas palustris]RIA00908.1 hypothetical protein D1920_12935 [Rhodopseudomonas palustris]